ncbi:hypothetical protein L6164_025877 [Bauhinia variegata]|uniref:Uncharacterized protein n=1 Tax=Bauhinia variegata TaxID=167791 RepID=A0ACB9M272_BAUVA|nr:hypothetical protein L6164_025877 [Bauhinia variegata]
MKGNEKDKSITENTCGSSFSLGADWDGARVILFERGSLRFREQGLFCIWGFTRDSKKLRFFFLLGIWVASEKKGFASSWLGFREASVSVFHSSLQSDLMAVRVNLLCKKLKKLAEEKSEEEISPHLLKMGTEFERLL